MEKAHIEKEYKMMIDEDIYNILLSSLNIKPFLQTNYYYDVCDSKMAMRIRQINDKYYFTLKVKGDGFKYEYEFEIAGNNLDDPKVSEVLDKFKIKQYKYLGKMETYRAIYRMNDGELCVDKSIYNNVIDYELEYELDDYQKDTFNEFKELLNKYKLDFLESQKTKYRRFLETIE